MATDIQLLCVVAFLIIMFAEHLTIERILSSFLDDFRDHNRELLDEIREIKKELFNKDED